MTDKNVDAVRAKLLARSEVGFRKYGVTTERDDLGLMDWLKHLQEELMDATVYIEAITAPIEYELTPEGRAIAAAYKKRQEGV